MGVLNEELTGLSEKGAQLVGAMSGVFQAGAVVGVLFVSWVMDRYGRKAGMLYCSAFSVLGGVLLTASNGVAMFIVARFFSGIGSWGFLAVTPVYSAELAPPKLRGFFVGLNGIFIAMGYALGMSSTAPLTDHTNAGASNIHGHGFLLCSVRRSTVAGTFWHWPSFRGHDDRDRIPAIRP